MIEWMIHNLCKAFLSKNTSNPASILKISPLPPKYRYPIPNTQPVAPPPPSPFLRLVGGFRVEPQLCLIKIYDS